MRALFFDFDGVILESVEIKTQAFYEMFLPFGEEIAKEVIAHHTLHGGVSRYEKFRHYYKTLLGKEISEEKIKELGNEFSDLVFSKVLKCDFIKDVESFLKKYHTIFDCYVVSGTPGEELKVIVEKRNLSQYFKAVYGSPTTKKEILELVISEKKYEPEKCYFFGDALTDLEAAKSFNIPFILVRSADNQFLEKDADMVIDDFTNLSLQ